MAPQERASAQVRSAIATVQLTAVVLPGVSFRAASGTSVAGASGSTEMSRTQGLTVNTPYSLRLHRGFDSPDASAGPAPIRVRSRDGAEHELGPGSTITLLSAGRPGLVALDAVPRSLGAVGGGEGAPPVTVDLVLDVIP